MSRCELSDFEWSVIQPNLPSKVRGVARVDDRRVLNGILWRFRTASPLADVPERYGPLHHLLQPVCSMAQSRGSGIGFWRRFPRLSTMTLL